MTSDCIEADYAGPHYPRRWVDGRRVYLHRLAWERAHGPIPAGAIVHHRCENKRCVNPAHLELLLGGRSQHNRIHHPRQDHCRNGHPFDETNTYVVPRTGGRRCKTCQRDRQRRDRGNAKLRRTT